jgi:hemerythrin superfamily protein
MTQKSSETEMCRVLLQGHDEVIRRVQDLGTPDVPLLDLLQRDHRAVLERIDRICGSTESNMAAIRADFLEMKSILEAHSLAEERVLYAKLKLDEGTMKSALAAGAEHELIARTLEDMGSPDLDMDQWMSLANSLREAVSQHVAMEESEIFEEARRLFNETQLKEMAGQMQYEKFRIFSVVA